MVKKKHNQQKHQNHERDVNRVVDFVAVLFIALVRSTVNIYLKKKSFLFYNALIDLSIIYYRDV